jgi:hypothetical protein
MVLTFDPVTPAKKASEAAGSAGRFRHGNRP